MNRQSSNFRFLKLLLKLQVFLLRRNLLGKASHYLMVITTTGRKTGKRYATPIGYLRDGDAMIAVNPHGRSNWYKNVLANPAVTLNIKGQTIAVRGEAVVHQAAIERLFELYRAHQPDTFPRLFGVTADAAPEELEAARDSRRFVRFYPAD